MEDEELENEDTGEQADNRHEHLKPWQFKPGQSGNPSGRPAGPSMKEWARIYLAGMDNTERLEFLKGMNKVDVWKLSEGNPKNDVDIKGEITKKVIIADE